MTRPDIVWAREGDTEWAICGRHRATITRFPPDAERIVRVRIAIHPVDDEGSDVTPAYRHFDADRLELEIEALRNKVERDMLLLAVAAIARTG